MNYWLVFFTIYITLIILIGNLDNVNLFMIATVGIFSTIAFVTTDLF